MPEDDMLVFADGDPRINNALKASIAMINRALIHVSNKYGSRLLCWQYAEDDPAGLYFLAFDKDGDPLKIVRAIAERGHFVIEEMEGASLPTSEDAVEEFERRRRAAGAILATPDPRDRETEQ